MGLGLSLQSRNYKFETMETPLETDDRARTLTLMCGNVRLHTRSKQMQQISPVYPIGVGGPTSHGSTLNAIKEIAIVKGGSSSYHSVVLLHYQVA